MQPIGFQGLSVAEIGIIHRLVSGDNDIVEPRLVELLHPHKRHRYLKHVAGGSENRKGVTADMDELPLGVCLHQNPGPAPN